MKKGDFVMTNVSGDQTGFDAAKAACGNDGFIYVHPGCSFVNPGLPLTDSLLVMMHEGGILRFYSGSKVRGAPVIGVAGDAQVEGVRFEDPGAGTNYVKIVAPSTPTTHTLTLPTANASGFLQNNGSGALSWAAGGATDTTGLVSQAGKSAGQTVIGSTAGTSSSTTYMALRGYNNSAITGAAYLKLNQNADIGAANINFTERTKTVGFNINTGSDFVNITSTGTLVCYGVGGNTTISGTPIFAVQGGTSTGLTVPTVVIKAKTSQTGKLQEWRDASNNVVASIDVAGNFTGSLGSAQKTAADTIQAFKTFLGGDLIATGHGVFTDSLRVNGTTTLGGDCNVSFGKWAVRDSIRANAGLTVGDAMVKKILSNTGTLDFPAITAPNTSDLTITVTGAAVGDVVSVGAPNGSVTAATIFTGWVSSANTVTVRASAFTGTPNPASGTFRVTVFQY